jgi:iron complex transport system permease protein
VPSAPSRAVAHASDDRHGTMTDASLPRTVPSVAALRAGGLPWRWLTVSVAVLAGAVMCGALLGPAGLPWRGTIAALVDRLPLVDVEVALTDRQLDILWQLRMPRVVLGGLVGATLAAGGAAYQGVFRNPLADPYLLGVAAGAGLGATLAIAYGPATGTLAVDPVPLAAFVGGMLAVGATYALGASAGAGRTSATVLLAGVAVASFLTAGQTFVQQQNDDTLRQVYSWILGSLTTSGWDDVVLVLPYVAVSAAVLVAHRRLLDVMRVGEDETGALGVRADRVRLLVVVAATLGNAAAVSVSGLIGFAGVIVPHTVRLLAGASYRIVLPLSIVFGAAFLVLADVVARTIAAPAELPIGVVTAFVGAPFFLVVLRSRRQGQP